MPRSNSHKMEGSWVDVDADSYDEFDDYDNMPRSATGVRSRMRQSRVSSSRISTTKPSRRGTSKVSSAYNSGFVMPKLDAEVPSPKPRQRKADLSQSMSDRAPKSIPKSRTSQNTISDGVWSAVITLLNWLLEIILGGLQVMKTPLKYLLGLYLLFGLIVITSNAVTSRLSAALTPICRVPGSGYIFPTLCEGTTWFDVSTDSTAEPEFDHLMQIQSRFEDLLHQSVDYYAVPAFMKHSQSAMRDVREVVRYSPLKSKNELLLEFDRFVSAASQASWDLESFNSHIGRTVDRITLTARWTQRTLDEIASPNVTKSLVGKAMDVLTSPFQPVKFTEDKVLDLYIKHSDEVQTEIGDLLTEAQAVFSLLKSLEDTIDSIHGITARDTYYAKLGRDEVLAELWSRLGGNRKQKAMFASQLKVLQQVSVYGQAAYTNIGAAILKLQTMSAEIDQLKERLVSVEGGGGGGTGIEGKAKSKVPLSVHLENIQLGVERLEEVRGYARDARLQKSRAVIGKGREAFGDTELHDGYGSLPETRKELPAGRSVG